MRAIHSATPEKSRMSGGGNDRLHDEKLHFSGRQGIIIGDESHNLRQIPTSGSSPFDVEHYDCLAFILASAAAITASISAITSS